jgi:hypothetical protein
VAATTVARLGLRWGRRQVCPLAHRCQDCRRPCCQTPPGLATHSANHRRGGM